MKNLYSFISLSLPVLFMLVVSFPSICFSQQPDSKVWDLFGKDSAGGVYYCSKTNIAKSSNIIPFKIYYIVTAEERKERMESGNESELLYKSIDYQNYDHDISSIEIDCKKKLTRVKEFTEYDNKGNVLKHNINKDREGKSIPPKSVIEEFYKKHCTTPKKPVKKK